MDNDLQAETDEFYIPVIIEELSPEENANRKKVSSEFDNFIKMEESKTAAKQKAVAKFKKIGLTAEEIEAIINI